MIFQEILADTDARVIPINKVLNESDPLGAFADHWRYIIEEINYYPIFHLAREIILSLTANKDVRESVKMLAQTAQRIVSMRAALRHDLMGRIYHRLLAEAKYLGTYYTSIPASILLLKLCLRPEAWPLNWHDIEEIKKFRIGDFACGTGTLLMASADSITDNYVSGCANAGQAVDLGRLQNVLAEDVLHGYDVLPSAIHLTASTLALRNPHIAFIKMNLFSLRLGGPKHSLGSIEFLKDRYVTMNLDLFGSGTKTHQVTGKAMKGVSSASVPDLDLCVMNPPFTRSVGGNLLFGSLPENERKQMQQDLKRLVQKHDVPANITAGLGSVFVATADPYIKPGGRIGLVLPKALLSGVAWGRTREILAKNYDIEYLIASHDPVHWNFSESTDLSEVLLVAAKKDNGALPRRGHVVALNLWRNPSTSFEALGIAHSLIRNNPPDIASGQGALEISNGKEKVGEAVGLSWNEMRANWLLPCAFAQSDLIRVAYRLIEGNLRCPGHLRVNRIPLCSLDELGYLGPDRRDIHDGFRLSKGPTSYQGFWGHDSKAILTLGNKPNCNFFPLPKAKKGRHLRKVEDLWPLAGRVLIAERLWLKTQRLVAMRLSQPVLSNVWWPFSFRKEIGTEQREKALVLWLNSTLGLLLLFINREETRGAWIDFKKPILANLPVLDLRILSADQLELLSGVYDNLSKKKLKPFPEMNTDDVRAEIDENISGVLNLLDLSEIRTLLAREPVVCLRRL
jgi:hypothetical protein